MPQRDQLILTTLLEIKQEKLNQAEIALKRRREELAAEFAKLTKAEEKLEAEALARQIAIDKLSEEISKISTAAKIDARRKHIQNVADPAYLIANDNLEKQKKAVERAEHALEDARAVVNELLKKIEKLNLSLKIAGKAAAKLELRAEEIKNDEVGSAGFILRKLGEKK